MWVRLCVTATVRKNVENRERVRKCVGVSVFQAMGDEVAVLAVVIDAAVSVVFTSR